MWKRSRLYAVRFFVELYLVECVYVGGEENYRYRYDEFFDFSGAVSLNEHHQIQLNYENPVKFLNVSVDNCRFVIAKITLYI